MMDKALFGRAAAALTLMTIAATSLASKDAEVRNTPEWRMGPLLITDQSGKPVGQGDVLGWTFPDGYRISLDQTLRVGVCNIFKTEYQIADSTGVFGESIDFETEYGGKCDVGEFPTNSPVPWCESSSPQVHPSKVFMPILKSGASYNFRGRARVGSYASYNHYGTSGCLNENIIGGKPTDWVYFSPPGTEGIKVKENWQGDFQPAMDFGVQYGEQLNEIGDALTIFPDGKYVSFASTQSPPYKVAFTIMALRTAEPARVSDGFVGLAAKSTAPCTGRMSVVVAASQGKQELKDLMGELKLTSSLLRKGADMGASFRRAMIRTDGINHQIQLRFECTGNSKFQVDFDVLGMSLMRLQ